MRAAQPRSAGHHDRLLVTADQQGAATPVDWSSEKLWTWIGFAGSLVSFWNNTRLKANLLNQYMIFGLDSPKANLLQKTSFVGSCAQRTAQCAEYHTTAPFLKPNSLSDRIKKSSEGQVVPTSILLEGTKQNTATVTMQCNWACVQYSQLFSFLPSHYYAQII